MIARDEWRSGQARLEIQLLRCGIGRPAWQQFFPNTETKPADLPCAVVFFSLAPGLVDPVSHGAKFACAMRIGGDGNLHTGFAGQTSILGRQVQPVRTGIDLEETPVLPCMMNLLAKQFMRRSCQLRQARQQATSYSATFFTVPNAWRYGFKGQSVNSSRRSPSVPRHANC